MSYFPSEQNVGNSLKNARKGVWIFKLFPEIFSKPFSNISAPSASYKCHFKVLVTALKRISAQTEAGICILSDSNSSSLAVRQFFPVHEKIVI